MLGIMAVMDQKDFYTLVIGLGSGMCRLVCWFACRCLSRCASIGSLQALNAWHYGRYGPEGQLPEAYRLWFFWEMTSVDFRIQRSAWFDSGYMHCVIPRCSH